MNYLLAKLREIKTLYSETLKSLAKFVVNQLHEY